MSYNLDNTWQYNLINEKSLYANFIDSFIFIDNNHGSELCHEMVFQT